MKFYDTSVVLDLLYPETAWHGWSANVFKTEAKSGAPILISHVVLAELHAAGDASSRQSAVDRLGFVVDPLDAAIARRAGIAHGEYRRRSGKRTAILADFLIGAHAAVRNIAQVTRDRRLVASYFPELEIVSPEGFQ